MAKANGRARGRPPHKNSKAARARRSPRKIALVTPRVPETPPLFFRAGFSFLANDAGPRMPRCGFWVR
jgi:hypothetical protein